MSIEVEYPEYHYQGMGCGLEDRGITDRYEAMQYGWDEAMERCASEVVEPLTARIEELEEVLKAFVNWTTNEAGTLALVDDEVLWKRAEEVLKK